MSFRHLALGGALAVVWLITDLWIVGFIALLMALIGAWGWKEEDL